MATSNSSGSAAAAPHPHEGHGAIALTFDLTLFEHSDGRRAAASPGADFLAGDPSWYRAGPITVHTPARETPSASAAMGRLVDAEHVIERLTVTVDALLCGLLALLPVELSAGHTLTVEQCAGLNAARVLARDVLPSALGDVDLALSAITAAADALRAGGQHG